MRVPPLMTWGKKRTMSIRIKEKRGSTGVCRRIGLQLPDRPSHASNSIPSTHIVPRTYLPSSPHPSSKGIYKCVRLYSSDALVHLRDFARGVCDGECAHYEYGRSPRKPRVVALGRRGMGPAPRSARGRTSRNEEPTTLGPEDRVCEREPDKSRVYIDVVEQLSAQVSSTYVFCDALQRFNCELFMCGPGRGLGCATNAEGSGESFFRPHAEFCPVHIRESRHRAMAFLSLSSRMSRSSTRQRVVPQRCVLHGCTRSLSLRHTGTRAGGR